MNYELIGKRFIADIQNQEHRTKSTYFHLKVTSTTKNYFLS